MGEINNKKCAQHLLDCMDHLEFKNVRDAKYGNEWIKCSDKLPDIETTVLIYEKGDILLSHLSDEGCIDWFGANNNYDVTHWMPLPEPPK